MAKVIGGTAVSREVRYYCPLLKTEIAESFCYDINSVAFGLCKPSLIDNATSREEAEPVCDSCENKAM